MLEDLERERRAGILGCGWEEAGLQQLLSCCLPPCDAAMAVLKFCCVDSIEVDKVNNEGR
jgi:hypothetical protein